MRYVSRDRRWRVDIIRLNCTSDNRDGEWLRVHRDGMFHSEVRTIAELGDVLDVADPEEA